jgi:hypothetical protein
MLKGEAEKVESNLEKEREAKERNKVWAATKIQSIYRCERLFMMCAEWMVVFNVFQLAWSG